MLVPSYPQHPEPVATLKLYYEIAHANNCLSSLPSSPYRAPDVLRPDQVLMGSSLWDVLTSLDLCKTIVNRIRLNYFWALLWVHSLCAGVIGNAHV